MLLVGVPARALALKTCASHDENVSYEEAEAIAREQVDFEPDKVLVRGVQRGLDAHLYWAVSLSTQNAAGVREECATVLVDAGTGEPQTDRASASAYVSCDTRCAKRWASCTWDASDGFRTSPPDSVCRSALASSRGGLR